MIRKRSFACYSRKLNDGLSTTHSGRSKHLLRSKYLSAVWRVSANDFDVDAYLLKHALSADAVFRKGETARDARAREQSGFNLVVSEADDAVTQVNEALKFIRQQQEALADLAALGIKSEIDFSLYVGSSESFVTSIHISEHVMAELAALGVGIDVTAYPTSDD
jgi:hypothetical protein